MIARMAIVLAAAGLALATPAHAKASLTKAAKLCEAKVEAQDPAPLMVRIDDSETRSNDVSVSFLLKVKAADGNSLRLRCVVDRKSSEVTVSPAE